MFADKDAIRKNLVRKGIKFPSVSYLTQFKKGQKPFNAQGFIWCNKYKAIRVKEKYPHLLDKSEQ